MRSEIGWIPPCRKTLPSHRLHESTAGIPGIHRAPYCESAPQPPLMKRTNDTARAPPPDRKMISDGVMIVNQKCKSARAGQSNISCRISANSQRFQICRRAVPWGRRDQCGNYGGGKPPPYVLFSRDAPIGGDHRSPLQQTGNASCAPNHGNVFHPDCTDDQWSSLRRRGRRPRRPCRTYLFLNPLRRIRTIPTVGRPPVGRRNFRQCSDGACPSRAGQGKIKLFRNTRNIN